MLDYSVLTNIGSRNVNEDSVGVFEKDSLRCFIVCDGLGGHGMGEVASSVVRDSFEQTFHNCTKAESFLDEAFINAQETLLEEQEKKHAKKKMKTTCVALLADNKHARIGHIGDSRLYVFSKDKIRCRTLDHSIPQMLVLSKDIKESEIRNHPQRGYVLKVMGIEWEKPQYELMSSIPLRKCKAFLLCTDGFWELIEDEDMLRLLKESDNVHQWLNEMEKIVIENGKDRNMDNYSAIAIWNIKE